MSLCDSIETLSMAYLDDELAAEERRELEAHLIECGSCRAHMESERADHSLLRKALVAPPAPDLFKQRMARALDADDRAQRWRWTRHLLPGSAIAAAAAAIFMFVGLRPLTSETPSPVATEAKRQVERKLPLEVQGAAMRPWLQQNFPDMQPPEFPEPNIEQVGARATAINGHDAVMLAYRVDTGNKSYMLTSVVMKNVTANELDGGDAVQVGSHMLHVIDFNGRVGVTYVDPNHRGYIFFAPDVSPSELVSLVAQSIDR